MCRQDKWPVLVGETPEGWRCALCRSEGATVVERRQEAAQRARRTRLAKGVSA